jgi:hypothetical protein
MARRTKVVVVDDVEFTLGKLTLDDLRDTDEAQGPTAKTMREVRERYRAICEASAARGGTAPGEVGKLDIDGLLELWGAVLHFSNVPTAEPGEGGSP